jgi:hypothetical protein
LLHMLQLKKPPMLRISLKMYCADSAIQWTYLGWNFHLFHWAGRNPSSTSGKPVWNRLKCPSHQIWSAWFVCGWIGLQKYTVEISLCANKFYLLFDLNLSSPRGVTKHDWRCMQLANFACRFACVLYVVCSV